MSKSTKGIHWIKASGDDFEDIFAYPQGQDAHSLIKCAPEMLDVLDRALHELNELNSPYSKPCITLIKITISKAKGQRD